MATIENGSNPRAARKAAAFVNVHLVSSKNAESKKSLGGVPLYADNALHAALLKHLESGGEVVLETSMHVVSDEVDFEF